MDYRNLEITLQSGKDLNKVNLFTKMDVYAVVSISGGGENPQSKQKTKTPVDHDGDANPTWNYPMKFTVDEAALQGNRLTLDIKLVCERALGDKDVGEAFVPIKELFDSPAKPSGADGKNFVSYQLRKPSGKPKGQIAFSFQFGEKIAGAAAAPPYGSAVPFAPPPYGKVSEEPVMAYPAGSSSGYQSSGVYPPPSSYAPSEGGGHYPPPPPQHGYGYPPPPPQAGYGYPPPPPQGGYGYPPQQGYGYAAAPMAAKPAKKNKLGMGLGAGLLGGALGGLLIGDMISDVGDYDCGGGFDF